MSVNAEPGRVFTGGGQPSAQPLADAWAEPEPYVASPDLVGAVNMALFLGRPLLLEGEPGSGKTRLAYAVAYELGYPLKANYIRSTSRARDLLYTFDAVRRLYDIQERAAAPREPGAAVTVPESKEAYVSLGGLGEAIALAQDDIPSVVLIDEIDKADIDFPNDLLLALDRLQFDVDEAPSLQFDALRGQRREARHHALPLVIITSNREKELPAPFLRRCLFAYIPFPDEVHLRAIIAKHFGLADSDDSLVGAALDTFLALRQQSLFTWRKAPGTSELLDWISMLRRGARAKTVSPDQLVDQPLGDLPYLETLVKTQSDRDALANTSSPTPAERTDA